MKIVHPPTIVASGRKNTKSASNALWIAMRLVSNDDNICGKLNGKAIIKANIRLFKIIIAANKYIETFTFGKNHFSV